ncbi:MAG: metallophosphoesterase family protein [Deltaproteobacteria bacterium]|nr:metallophosphoesterase family protein [Deltaproteobacteria bacterium]
MVGRTFVIGDIHGELAMLDQLLGQFPELEPEDTLLFLGDYVDRGPDSRGVVARVREIEATAKHKVVALRGNHEDLWIDCYERTPHLGFLLPRANGCPDTYRSFVGGERLPLDSGLPHDEIAQMCNVRGWFPADVLEWFKARPCWYEDEHAIYVHAGLDGDVDDWKHPRDGREPPLLWMREISFYRTYRGKRVIFGHTPVTELPIDHLGLISRWLDDPGDVWERGDLIGLDTGAGKGGHLSAIELPSGRIYEGR